MEKPILSPDFTIEDIHKIREQNYERTKDMTVAEKIAYYNNFGKEVEREIERRLIPSCQINRQFFQNRKIAKSLKSLILCMLARMYHRDLHQLYTNCQKSLNMKKI